MGIGYEQLIIYSNYLGIRNLRAMKLSIIIPVHNEKATIKEILRRIRAVDTQFEREIIIVDDCSRDGTREILKEEEEREVRVFFHEQNIGKGAAIKTGLKHVTGDYVLIQDSDLEYDPKDYPLLLEPILVGKAIHRFTRYNTLSKGNWVMLLQKTETHNLREITHACHFCGSGVTVNDSLSSESGGWECPSCHRINYFV